MNEPTVTQKHQAKMVEEFVKSYMYCALWLCMDDEDDYLDANYSIEDIAPETVQVMTEDCKKFISQAEEMLDDSDNTYDQGGYDFWLTRNGHGIGFWDGDWPKYGDKLTEICEDFKEVYLYIGDDKKIYQEG